jgi:hypothetical protein
MMRNLNIDELESKIHDYALDVEYIDKQHLNIKVIQFINFLDSQPISKRILERFSEDYKELLDSLPKEETFNWRKQQDEIIKEIKTPELQGALGYFLIRDIINSTSNNNYLFLNLAKDWFDSRGDYDQCKDDFNTFLFKPFIKLLNWYISESQSYNSKDYFSKNEINEFSDKIDELLNNVRLGQEVIFVELQDLKEQLKNIKKKNWVEILKGKLFDLTLNKVIEIETFSMMFKAIVGEDINFLES